MEIHEMDIIFHQQNNDKRISKADFCSGSQKSHQDFEWLHKKLFSYKEK